MYFGGVFYLCFCDFRCFIKHFYLYFLLCISATSELVYDLIDLFTLVHAVIIQRVAICNKFSSFIPITETIGGIVSVAPPTHY